ncbi:MHYT domain-containing protein [Brevundimonas sp. GCM10030266]|uniref:MHYT domain-containing protein n=1 Tax=Brevundimonas sp. GCM10030266 TaxID=3273386 RepID=UPI003606A53E
MHHDHHLIYPLLSAVVAICGSWTALDLFRRARTHDGQTRFQWIGLSAIAMGVSIWSMHFVAMLGFNPGAPVSYDPARTLGSLALAVAGTAFAFAFSGGPTARLGRQLGGGALMGVSVGGMHYLGMSAIRSTVQIHYDPVWVAASVVVAFLASFAALVAVRRNSRAIWQAGAAVLLGAGVVAMHYTAMGAVGLTHDGSHHMTPGMPPLYLAFAVAGLTLLLLFLALGASLMDQRQVLSMALRAGRLGYWEMDIPRRRLSLSEQARGLMGFEPSEPFEQSMVPARLTIESAARRQAALERSIRDGADYEVDYELLDGRWLEVRGLMTLDGAGHPLRLVGTIQDVTSHRIAFQALARSEARQRILINELNHRVKNTLATVLSIATLTARRSDDVQAFAKAFQARLLSLSATHNLLTAEGWQQARLSDVFRAEFGHYNDDQVVLEGQEILLGSENVLTLGLIAHELATNAAKYGALSRPEGRVKVRWRVAGDTLSIEWREHGGPPVRPPERKGFGSRLIASSATGSEFRYPETGFEADITMRLFERRTDIPELPVPALAGF